MDNRQASKTSFIDWLSFTWRDSSVDSINVDDEFAQLKAFKKEFPEFEVLFDDPNTVQFHGRSHYNFGVIWNNFITVSYDSAIGQNKGILVQISSQGLAPFCDLLGMSDVRDLFILLDNRNAKFTRIDVSHDDYTKTFSPFWYFMQRTKYGENIADSAIVSSSNVQKFGFISDGSSGSGSTFYCGSLKKRTKVLRIYDKCAESDGQIDAIRYEFETHGNHAQAIALSIINKTFSFRGLLTNFMRVIDRENYKNHNKSEVPTLPEWDRWLELEFSEETDFLLRLPVKQAHLSVERRLKYVLGSWPMHTLRAAVEVFGFENIMQLIKDAVLGKHFEGYELTQFQNDIQGFEYEWLLALKESGLKSGIFY